ncbi:hypothetical protein B0T24DRAFT_679940 [Lasiosphaeria ovina]|uniref:Serine hydrolase domain-containing protein n=1 Tax=Lasiosphaeria ovina TaxID=92902 RepID=A0AAE0K7I3_9PEZI|nr:hypothetical protein B0T24DRAFT_679940 [Lasiosphaeria ovina]
MPSGVTAEDSIYKLAGELGSKFHQGTSAVRVTLERLFAILDQNPEIDMRYPGLLRKGHGRVNAHHRGSPLYAIFFSGWPPARLRDDETIECLLANECGNLIEIPTCHIVGCDDPYMHCVMALFAMCDDDTAVLFDYGKGHTAPRDPRTIEELASAMART